MGQDQSTPSEGPEDPDTISGPCRKDATVLGLVADPKLQRDSLTSVRIGDRQFWTARDSTCFDGQPFFFFTSTASWTYFNDEGRPDVINSELRTYGENNITYFPPGPDQFPPHGNSGNGQERWLIWPDSPPLPLTSPDGKIVKLYTWIKNVHQNPRGEIDTGDFPSTSLYCIDHHPIHDEKNKDNHFLPPARLLNPNFWPKNSTSYGSYGWLVAREESSSAKRDPYIYLYGLLSPSSPSISVSRVPSSQIENPNSYTFYSPPTSTWTPNPPQPSDLSFAIPNAGTGQQGTFFYSSHFRKYMWVGGISPCDSRFGVATAERPEGPWSEVRVFYTAEPGRRFAGYSWQVHVGLDGRKEGKERGEGEGKEVYLSFTRINRYYETVLIRVEWF